MVALMKKIFRWLAGLLGAAVNVGIFGGLSWWVSTENSTVGYIAAGLFGIMAVLGAVIVFVLIAFDDKTPPVKHAGKQKKSADKLDAGTVAADLLVGPSGQFHDSDGYDAGDDYSGEDYSDDMSDFD